MRWRQPAEQTELKRTCTMQSLKNRNISPLLPRVWPVVTSSHLMHADDRRSAEAGGRTEGRATSRVYEEKGRKDENKGKTKDTKENLSFFLFLSPK